MVTEKHMNQKDTKKESRVDRKAEKEEKKQKKPKQKKLRIRKFPIILRVLLVLIVLVISLTVGLLIGYGVIGDGEASDVLEKATWQHIIDIIEKE